MKQIWRIFFTPFWWVPVTGWCWTISIPGEYAESDRSFHKIYRKGKRLRIIEIREIVEK